MTEEIQKELTDCRAAFEANPTAKSAWCCHHEQLWELLTESYKNRIAYILDHKPEAEQAVRLRNFRPCSQHDVVLDIDAKYWAERDAITAKCWAERDAITAKYWAERGAVYAKYWAERDALDAKYWAELMAYYKADVPQGTWNGKSIFGGESK